VVEETEETLFWLELVVEAALAPAHLVSPLMAECEELLRIFATSLATSKANR
jgi:hypothetical protein